MKISPLKLAQHLDGRLASVYLVSGDEPLLVEQATDQIRAAARRQGFTEREVHTVERGFRWAELEHGMDNLSLFASRRIVELRLPSPRPGDSGARAIRSLAEARDPDRLVLIKIAAKLDGAAARSAWVKAIEQHGVAVGVWPVERSELPRWIHARAAALDLTLTPDAAELLADRVEGNLLAADQELVKLSLTGRTQRLDDAAILEAVTHSARFDVFRLTDAIVAADAPRALVVLAGLRSEGTQPVLVAWALSREIGLLLRLKYAEEHGEDLDNALARYGVWRKRRAALKQAVRRLPRERLVALLSRAAAVDLTLKGLERGDPWEALTGLVLAALDSRALATAA